MASFFDKVKKMFIEDKKTAKGVGKTYPNQMSRMYDLMAVERDRRKIYDECWTMYSEDARCAAAVDTTAGSATNGAFTINFNKSETDSENVVNDAQDILSKLNKDTKLPAKVLSIAKEFLILGDVFLEVVVDYENLEIVDLKKLPARTIERVEDEFGNLKGFVQKNELDQVIANFEPWQILHMRWNNFTGQMYGTSMLKAVRAIYKKLRMTEEDLVIRRRTRAGLKLHHYGADPQEPLEEDEVDEYMETNKSTPMNVRTDFYSNGKWKIDVLRSDDGVNEINDITHFEETLFIGLRTPKGLLGIGDGANKATLERQEVAYIRLLNEITNVISEQLKDLFDLALKLKGLDPNNVEYRLVWGEKTIEDTNSKTERLILQANGGFISKETATNEMGYDFEDEMAKIEKEREKYDFLDFEQTKFVDPNAQLKSNREKVKHQKRTDDGKETQKTTLDGTKNKLRDE